MLFRSFGARARSKDHRRILMRVAAGAHVRTGAGNHDGHGRPTVGQRSARPRDAADDPRGTPTLYYGDDIVIHQSRIAPVSAARSVRKNVPGSCRRPIASVGPLIHGIRKSNAWFSTSPSWLPLANDFDTQNVIDLDADAQSLLSLYKGADQTRQHWPQLSQALRGRVAAQEPFTLLAGGLRRGAHHCMNLGAEPPRSLKLDRMRHEILLRHPRSETLARRRHPHRPRLMRRSLSADRTVQAG